MSNERSIWNHYPRLILLRNPILRSSTVASNPISTSLQTFCLHPHAGRATADCTYPAAPPLLIYPTNCMVPAAASSAIMIRSIDATMEFRPCKVFAILAQSRFLKEQKHETEVFGPPSRKDSHVRITTRHRRFSQPTGTALWRWLRMPGRRRFLSGMGTRTHAGPACP